MADKSNIPQKTCHRHMVPLAALIPVINPITKQEQVQELHKAGFVACLEEHCAIWDASKKQCGDKTKFQALSQLADILFRKENSIQLVQDGE